MRRRKFPPLLCLAALVLCGCKDDGGAADGTGTGGSSDEGAEGTAPSDDAADSSDAPCIDGTESCPCDQGLCDAGLSCLSELCVETPVATCGDAILGEGEECDNGPLNSNAGVCKADCTLQVCGDGAQGPGEECDDGNTSDVDNCTSACRAPVCGNEIVEGAEACDDGNQDDSDGCPRSCLPASCGDGFVLAGSSEQCDDGNDATGDGCSPTCTIEALCGDSEQIAGEFCWLPPVTLLAGQTPVGVAIGDFTGDGLTDAVVANGDDSNFSIAKGNGAGILAVRPPETTGDTAPAAIAVGDFDADDLPDVAFAHPASGTVTIAWGNALPEPPASLLDPQSYAHVSFAGARTLATVDLDPALTGGLVQNELLVGTADGVALIVFSALLGNVDRDTPIISGVSLGADDWAVGQADFDGDNIGTAVAVGRATGALHRLIYQPSPHILAAGGHPPPLTLPGLVGPTAVASGKFNGDNADDLVFGIWDPACDYAVNPTACANETIGTVLGLPAGDVENNGASATVSTLTAGKAPSAIALADLDGDNEVDLVVANRFDDTLSVFAGDGSGAFVLAAELSVSGHEVSDIELTDLDGDGRLDLISLETYTNTISVFLSNP